MILGLKNLVSFRRMCDFYETAFPCAHGAPAGGSDRLALGALYPRCLEGDGFYDSAACSSVALSAVLGL